MRCLDLRAARDLAHEHARHVGVHAPAAEQAFRDASSCSRAGSSDASISSISREQIAPRLAEDRVEHLVLRGEVVVEQAVRDARLLGDVADARGVEALVREHPDGGVEDETPFLLRTRTLDQGRRKVLVGSGRMQRRRSRGCSSSTSRAICRGRLRRPSCSGWAPVSCGSSSRAATRCGQTAPGWHDALNAGKESVVCDLPGDAPFLRAPARPGRRRARELPAGRARAARGQTPGHARGSRGSVRSRASGTAGGTSSGPGTT